MRTTIRLPLVAATLAASLTLAACNGRTDDSEELPDPEISGTADPVSGAEIEEAVPGIEAADPEGNTPNTADLSTDENIETAEPGDLEDPPHGGN